MVNKKYDEGDVHAPVEDTDVPFSLKVFVIFMIGVLILVGIIVALLANQFGLFHFILIPPTS
jgi:hypothetical protein